MKKVAIIVAGGSGTRMGTSIPKQFLKLHGKEIILYTIEQFLTAFPNIEIILVLPKTHFSRWKKIADKHNLRKIKLAEGGTTRFESVKSGLSFVDSNSLVAVHDAVRPMVSIETIRKTFEGAQKFAACVPVFNLNESIRQVSENGSNAVNRAAFRLVQTPQCFQAKLLKVAYKQKYKIEFTDDAAVVENHGAKINLVEGNAENIKITRPMDLILAKYLMKENLKIK